MKKILKAIKSPTLVFRYVREFFYRGYAKVLLKISPEGYIKFRYKILFGNHINLKNPQSFAEKIQWLKLNDRDERIVTYADKYLVREYIKKTIGDKYLIPMPFVWDTPEQVDFSVLPEKFVLKPNNSSGRVLICKDKNKFNKDKAFKIMEKWKKENLTKKTGEWVYEKIPFKIVCEEYLADEIMDYKFYFAGGNFICTQIIAGRGTSSKQFGYFDSKWNLLDIKRSGMKAFDLNIEKPSKYDEMIEIASKLAKDFRFMRVDLYYVNEKIYFGELSFYPNNGFVKYETEEMDKFFSDKINLDFNVEEYYGRDKQ